MKTLSSSDWHIHPYKAFSSVDGVTGNARLEYIVNAWDEMLDIAKERNVDLLTISGDVFNVRGIVKTSAMSRFYHMIMRATKVCPVVFIPGNHDMEDYKGGPTALDILEGLPDVYVMGKPSTLSIRGIRIAGIPYQPTAADWEKAATSLLEPDIDMWLCHQGIDDFKPSAGIPDTSLTVERIQDVIGPDIPAFFGHYHKPDVSDNVVQCGAPVQHNWGDAGNERGCWIYDHDEKTVDFIELHNHPKFVVAGESDHKLSARLGDFIKIKSSDPDVLRRVKTEVEGVAGGLILELTKEFDSAHKESLKVGNVPEMIAQYMRITGGGEISKSEEEALLSMYKEVCL